MKNKTDIYLLNAEYKDVKVGANSDGCGVFILQEKVSTIK